jgi:UDP-N-acetylmuramate--alanine ligase
MDLERVKKIFFVGIGGIGMSGLARYFKLAGKEIYGYDRVSTGLTKMLEAEGMNIIYTEDLNGFPGDTDLIIRTPAVPAHNIFLSAGKKQGVPIMKRAQVLGEISRSYRAVAVAGTHGKTTTSSMVAWLLKSCGVDCSAFLGGIALNFQSNFLFGQSNVVVLEADEYDRSFLQLNPEIAVITSMDADHLDIYGSKGSVRTAYIEFADAIKSGGVLVIHESIADYITRRDIRILSYGQTEKAAYRWSNLVAVNGGMAFSLSGFSANSWDCFLPYPGQHNVENAVAAMIVAELLGCKKEGIVSSLQGFKGIKRRFELVGSRDGLIVIDDYAHHPAEINAAIQAVRMMYPGKRITGVFQPHLYSRTKDFSNEFAESLDTLDACLLLDLYPAREEPVEGVSSQIILDAMELENRALCRKEELIWRLLQMPLEVLLIMGAGDIDTLIPDIKTQILNEV